MSTAEAIRGGRSGPVFQTRSTAISDTAKLLASMGEELQKHLLDSYTVGHAAERGLDELEEVRKEASREGWDGYGGKPVNPEAYKNARLFLEAIPATAPSPEVSADPDGDIALDWVFGYKKALTISIGPAGRCTFAWMRGQRTYRGTEYLDDDGIPASIAQALWELARDTRPVSETS